MENLVPLLPWLNAAGIPILAFAVFVLIRALKQQNEFSKGANEDCKQLVSGLQAEVQRLRAALESADLAYQRSMERIRELSARSSFVASALSEVGTAAPKDDDTQIQVGEAVAMVSRLLVRLHVLEERLRSDHSRMSQELFERFYADVAELLNDGLVFTNPHARWALTVVLGGSLSRTAVDPIAHTRTGEPALTLPNTSSADPNPQYG